MSQAINKKNEYRKNLAEIFIKSLEENGLDWKKEWHQTQARPFNAKSNAHYRGINLFRLMMESMDKGYDDPRWATFNQVKDMGCSLKGAKGTGVLIEYWFPYDREEKKAITWKKFKEETGGVPDERYILSVKYSTVFNAKYIEGIKPLPLPEKREILIDDLVETLSKEMDVEILNDGDGRAFYRPKEDKIHLPEKDDFYSDYAYNSTALHELAHATGAEHRLNRNLVGDFGSEAYAYEELIAEITSCFMSYHLEIEQDEQHVNNHAAYVNSWISILKDKPETLVKAIADAEKASSYMELKAGLIRVQEYEKSVESTLEVESKKEISEDSRIKMEAKEEIAPRV